MLAFEQPGRVLLNSSFCLKMDVLVKVYNSLYASHWVILILPLIYRTAASRATPGSQGHPIIVNDAEGQQPGRANASAPRVAQNPARPPRPREQHNYGRGVQVQEPRPTVTHQRNNYNRYYENRYYGNHGGQVGYRGGGGYEREYHQQNNYIQGMPGTYYPGYGQCHLCGK